MIGPGTGVRVYLACGVTDMRKGIAGIGSSCCIGMARDFVSITRCLSGAVSLGQTPMTELCG